MAGVCEGGCIKNQETDKRERERERERERSHTQRKITWYINNKFIGETKKLKRYRKR